MIFDKTERLIAFSLSLFMLQSIPVTTSASSFDSEVIDTVLGADEMIISDEKLALDVVPEKLYSTLLSECDNAVSLDANTYYDLYSLGTINSDGTKSLMTFNSPIKYFDEGGDVRFIENTIIPVEDTDGIAYENEGNSYHVAFPESIDKGVSISYNGFSLSMIPVTQESISKVQLSDTDVVYSDVFDEFSEVRYTLDDLGIKESIVLSEANGKSTYDFTFRTQGLIPENKEGTTITFVDEETGEVAFIIQPTYIVDSYSGDFIDGEEHFTYDNYYVLEEESDYSYTLHMNLDEDFLNAETTQYPCVIDPSIWAAVFTNDSSSYVLQSGGSAYVNSQLSAGNFNGSGEHISYVKPNSVKSLRWIEPNRLQSATFNVKAASSGYTNECTIDCYDSTTTSSISSVTFSELNSSLGDLQSSTTFTALGSTYSFNVTSLFRQWITFELGEGGKNPAYGFILKGATGACTPGRWFSSTSSSDTYFYLVYQEGEEIEDGFYNIKNVETGTYLRYNSGGQLYMSSSPSLNACKWQAILSKSADGETTYGTYTLNPFNDLNVSMKGTATGSAVTTNASGNVFRIIRNADGTFRIMPTSYANVSNAIGISSNYAYIQEYSNISSMKWTFEPVVNKYFSEFTPSNVNGSTYSNYTRLRSNCYGYAFGHILHYEEGDYCLQQPGDFCLVNRKGDVLPRILYNPTAYLNNVVSNMQLDAERFGYTMTEYIPSGSSVNQFGARSRLIAVVTGNTDYHFYMQHNDGTWSHKPGSTEAKNYVTIRDERGNEQDIYLTNDNIMQYANTGYYLNGDLKFFIITKDAVIDHPHGSPSSSSLTTLYYEDEAGDFKSTSTQIYSGTTSGRFDFNTDVDYFVFQPTSTKSYSFITSNSLGYDINAIIYDKSGNVYATAENLGDVNISFYAIGGSKYYIKLYNQSALPGEYTISIS